MVTEVKGFLITAFVAAAIAGCSNGDALIPETETNGNGSGGGSGSSVTAKGGSGGIATAGATGGAAAGSGGAAAAANSGNAVGAKGVADASVTSIGSAEPDATAGGCGLPANVVSMLASACTSCHSSPPINGAVMPLVTYADLIAPSVSNPSETVGALCVTRMQSTAAPMPPAGNPAPSVSAAAAFDSWVSAGMPQAPCGTTGASGSTGASGTSGSSGVSGSSGTSGSSGVSGASGSMSGASGTSTGSTGADASVTSAPVCTSKMMAPATFGPTMEPGDPCVTCHNTFLAGTVYPTAHEPNGCDGVNVSNATVQVTDAKGIVTSIAINNVGNFYTNGSALTPPVQVEVVYNGTTRSMATPLTIGDCNSCHTEQGDNGAPGRIMLP
jgi:hypothetical protein